MCVFKCLTDYIDCGGYENRNAHFFNNNEIKGNEELMLLHDQNDGWTVPNPYLMVCCKNIYLRMLFKEAYIA